MGLAASLVVFDLDGTLVDSLPDLAAAVNRSLAHLAPGAPPLPVEVVRGFVGKGARNLVLQSLAAAGVEEEVERALPVFLDCYSRCLLDATRPYPGVEEALERLGDRTLAVLTNKPGEFSRRILDGLALARHFSRILGGGDLPERKPDPAGLRRLLAETETPVHRALMVGDSPIDVHTGRAAGVPTAGVTYGYDPQGLIAAGPDLLVRGLPELATILGAPPLRGRVC